MMVLLVVVVISTMLVFVLSAKFTGFDRGVDSPKNTGPGGPPHGQSVCEVSPHGTIIREPYVLPEVDRQIKEQMESLQQVLVPVQYLDNGLMNTIQTHLPSAAQALSPIEYVGPAPFEEVAQYPNGGYAQRDFQNALVDVTEAKALADVTLALDAREDLTSMLVGTSEIEPFNSLSGMVVSDGQTVSEYIQT